MTHYGVWCEVSGGVTGYRAAWLKSNGQLAKFETLEDANNRARELQQKRDSDKYRTADYSYRAREMD